MSITTRIVLGCIIVLGAGAILYVALKKPATTADDNAVQVTNENASVDDGTSDTNIDENVDGADDTNAVDENANIDDNTNAATNSASVRPTNTVENTNAAANTNTSSNTNTSVNTNVSAVKATTVTVTASGFSPKSVTINVGDEIIWKNSSGDEVYVAPDVHPTHTKYAGVWDDTGAGDIQDGESYSFTFNKANTYTYHNHLSASQTGTIVVK